MVSLLSLLSLAAFTFPAQDPQQARKFIVSPQAVPSPALRYVLLPPLKDLKTGNAVQHYYRCFSPDAIQYYRHDHFDQHLGAWLDLPYEQAARKGLPSAKQQPQKKLDDGSDEVCRLLAKRLVASGINIPSSMRSTWPPGEHMPSGSTWNV